MGRLWQASGRVLEPDRDGNFYAEVRELAREKYGWGNGLPIEFRVGATNLEYATHQSAARREQIPYEI